jgi:hypothetical protein
MKLIIFFFFFNMILSIKRFKGGGINEEVILHKIKAGKAEALKSNFLKILEDSPRTIVKDALMYLAINITKERVRIYFIAENEALKLGITTNIVLNSDNNKILYYWHEFDFSQTNTFLTTFLRPINDGKVTNIFYRFTEVTTKFDMNEETLIQQFEVGYLNEVYNNKDMDIITYEQSKITPRIAQNRNKALTILIEELSGHPDINKFSNLVSLLYLTNRNDLFENKNIGHRLVDGFNDLTVKHAKKLKSDFSPKTFMYEEEETLFRKYFELYETNIKNAELDDYPGTQDIIDKLFNKVLANVDDELKDINLTYSYLGLKDMVASYLKTKYAKFKGSTKFQQVMLGFAGKVIELRLSLLTYNPIYKYVIECKDKIEFFSNLKDAFTNELRSTEEKSVKRDLKKLGGKIVELPRKLKSGKTTKEKLNSFNELRNHYEERLIDSKGFSCLIGKLVEKWKEGLLFDLEYSGYSDRFVQCDLIYSGGVKVGINQCGRFNPGNKGKVDFGRYLLSKSESSFDQIKSSDGSSSSWPKIPLNPMLRRILSGNFKNKWDIPYLIPDSG